MFGASRVYVYSGIRAPVFASQEAKCTLSSHQPNSTPTHLLHPRIQYATMPKEDATTPQLAIARHIAVASTIYPY